MADVPLTESRLTNLLEMLILKFDIIDTLFKSIDVRFELIDKRIVSIDKQLQELHGFKTHDSHTIEYELQMVIQAHIKKITNGKTIIPYEMKRIYNPYTGKELTEFDGAFIIEQTQMPFRDISRLQAIIGKKNAMKFTIENQYEKENDMSKGFILVEAKHHINEKKIKTKLEQFTQLLEIFKLAKEIKGKLRNEIDPIISDVFIKQVEHDKDIAKININKCFLYLGSSNWDKKLYLKLYTDLDKYKNLVNKFEKIAHKTYDKTKIDEKNILLAIEKDNADKIQIYNKTNAIEFKWYTPIILKDEEVIRLSTIQSPFSKIKLILPSGNRYAVDDIADEPEYIATLPMQGGKTRKNKVYKYIFGENRV